MPYFLSAQNSHNQPSGPRGLRGQHVGGLISPSLLPPPRAGLCLCPGCASPTCPRCTTGQLGDHALTSKGAVLTPSACGAQRARARQRAQGPGRVAGQQSCPPWGPRDTNLSASPPLPVLTLSGCRTEGGLRFPAETLPCSDLPGDREAPGDPSTQARAPQSCGGSCGRGRRYQKAAPLTTTQAARKTS